MEKGLLVVIEMGLLKLLEMTLIFRPSLILPLSVKKSTSDSLARSMGSAALRLKIPPCV